MLPKSNRLSKSNDVKAVLSKGKAFFSPYFLAKVKKLDPNVGNFKFTVVVSTKVSKKAVQRNRIKRIIREQVRINKEKIRPGAYIFTAKPKILEIYDDRIAQEFINFLKKATII